MLGVLFESGSTLYVRWTTECIMNQKWILRPCQAEYAVSWSRDSVHTQHAYEDRPSRVCLAGWNEQEYRDSSVHRVLRLEKSAIMVDVGNMKSGGRTPEISPQTATDKK